MLACPHGPCPPPGPQRCAAPMDGLRLRQADHLSSRPKGEDGERCRRPNNARSTSAAVGENAVPTKPAPNRHSDGERPPTNQPSVAPVDLAAGLAPREQAPRLYF